MREIDDNRPLLIAQAANDGNSFAEKANQETNFLYGQVEKKGKGASGQKQDGMMDMVLPPLESGVAKDDSSTNLNAVLETYRGPVISGFFKVTHEEQRQLFDKTPELSADLSWHMNFITVPKGYPRNQPFGFYVMNDQYNERTGKFKSWIDRTYRLEGKLVDDPESGVTYFVGSMKHFARGRAIPSGELDNFWVPLTTQYDHSSDAAILASQRERWLKSSKTFDKWAHDDREKMPPPPGLR